MSNSTVCEVPKAYHNKELCLPPHAQDPAPAGPQKAPGHHQNCAGCTGQWQPGQQSSRCEGTAPTGPARIRITWCQPAIKHEAASVCSACCQAHLACGLATLKSSG